MSSDNSNVWKALARRLWYRAKGTPDYQTAVALGVQLLEENDKLRAAINRALAIEHVDPAWQVNLICRELRAAIFEGTK